ncbi:hypothetical protein C8Q76DRAFT_45886 [Earliella scabrosa]|nr:hypothetical protein C8Q76DRAFT_45886 [Earliella scabrosa]
MTPIKFASSVHLDVSSISDPHIRHSLCSPGWNVVALWRVCKDYPQECASILNLSQLTLGDPEIPKFTSNLDLYPGGSCTLSELHTTFRRGSVSPAQLRRLVKHRTIRDIHNEFFTKIYDPLRPVKNLKETPWADILAYEQEVVEILEKALALAEARVVLLMREAELEDKPEDSDASQGNRARRLFDQLTRRRSRRTNDLDEAISTHLFMRVLAASALYAFVVRHIHDTPCPNIRLAGEDL